MQVPLPDRDWPELPPLEYWQDTFQTVHLSAQGLSPRPLVDGAYTFQIDFDFVDHAL